LGAERGSPSPARTASNAAATAVTAAVDTKRSMSTKAAGRTAVAAATRPRSRRVRSARDIPDTYSVYSRRRFCQRAYLATSKQFRRDRVWYLIGIAVYNVEW